MAITLSVGMMMEAKFFINNSIQQSINVLHWRVSAVGGVGLTDAQVAANLDTVFAAYYKPIIAPGASYIGIRLQIILPKPPFVAQVSKTATGPGTATGDLLPPQVSGLASITTASAGRSYRGRIYFGFHAEGDNTAAGFPSANVLTNMSTFLTGYLTTRTVTVGANSVTLIPCLFHKKTGTYTDFLGGIIRSTWATQRRRSMANRADILGP